jgi:hypothetical protein
VYKLKTLNPVLLWNESKLIFCEFADAGVDFKVPPVRVKFERVDRPPRPDQKDIKKPLPPPAPAPKKPSRGRSRGWAIRGDEQSDDGRLDIDELFDVRSESDGGQIFGEHRPIRGESRSHYGGMSGAFMNEWDIDDEYGQDKYDRYDADDYGAYNDNYDGDEFYDLYDEKNETSSIATDLFRY